MWLLILLSWFSRGSEVDRVMAARGPEQLLLQSRSDEEQKILGLRCQAEVKGGYLPSHCFLLLQKVHIGKHERRFLESWFESACVKSLQQRSEQTRYKWGSFKNLKGACRSQFVTSAKGWLYKVQKESDAKVIQLLVGPQKIGKEIELVLSYGDMEKKNIIPPAASGALR